MVAADSPTANGHRPPRYRTVLLDLDHTLFDTEASERLAFDHALTSVGIDQPDRFLATYDRINRALWAAVERGETTPGQVRTARFEQLVAAERLDADPVAMADIYVDGFARFGELYPGALDILGALAATSSLALVTNGLSEVQRTRIERLDIGRFFDAVVISGEVGVSKPAVGIFDLVFAELGDPPRTTALMVGDSLSSDIRGGANSGLATCWYNPHGRPAGPDDHLDHEIRCLAHLPKIVVGTGS